MPSTKGLATALLAIAFAGSLQLDAVAVLPVGLMAETGPVQLRARTIVGTVTLDGKPIDGTVLSLHKYLGAYSIELAHADAHALGKAITAKNGRFRFDEVPTGKYVVFVRGASFEVEIIKPKSGESDIIAIESSFLSCLSVAVFSADGRKLRHGLTSPCY